jgi:peroxiredoxin family protein
MPLPVTLDKHKSENAIWKKRMCQQRRVSLGILNDAKKMKFLLPVCRHVHDLLELREAQSLLKEQQSQYDKGLA